MLATVVDTEALWQTILAALVAGVGITLVFSIAILGAARFSEASAAGRTVGAAFFAVIAVLGVLATLGAVVVGVIVMASK